MRLPRMSRDCLKTLFLLLFLLLLLLLFLLLLLQSERLARTLPRMMPQSHQTIPMRIPRESHGTPMGQVPPTQSP